MLWSYTQDMAEQAPDGQESASYHQSPVAQTYLEETFQAMVVLLI